MIFVVTGNSCVGKSTLVKQLALRLGVKVFDADVWTADQYDYNADFRAYLMENFRTMDKGAVREILIQAPHLLSPIMECLRPYFEQAVRHFVKTHYRGIIDMAHYFEANFDHEKLFGNITVINVTANEETRKIFAEQRGVEDDTRSLYDRKQYAPAIKSVLANYTFDSSNWDDISEHRKQISELEEMIDFVEECAQIYSRYFGPTWFGTEDYRNFCHLVFKVLVAYKRNGMAYHNFEHILYMLRGIKTVLRGGYYSSMGIQLFWEILFHDIVYDPARSDNEEQSAKTAMDWLKAYYPRFTYVELRKIASGILSTKLGFTQKGHINSGGLDDYLHDLDYKILADDHAVAANYDIGIYLEYIGLCKTPEEYFEKRIAVLKSFLEGPIYRHSWLTDWEEAARKNIEMLIELNEGQLRDHRANNFT